METWYIVLLAVIAVIAVAILLIFSLIGDDSIRKYRMKHRRGEYINDQTAIICQSIKATDDPEKAYQLFVEYLFANNRHFLSYVSRHIRSLCDAFIEHDVPGLHAEQKAIEDMKIELKDQYYTQRECMSSISPIYYMENSLWIRLSINCRFDINQSLRQIAKVSAEYYNITSDKIGKNYIALITKVVKAIVNICRRSSELLHSGDIEGMKALRHDCKDILLESQEETQRIYDILNDGRSETSPEDRLRLNYVLNCMRECHFIIYTLRRLVLCNIGKALSIRE